MFSSFRTTASGFRAAVGAVSLLSFSCGTSDTDTTDQTQTQTPRTDANGYVACDATDRDGLRACFPDEEDRDDAFRLYTEPIVIAPGDENLYCSELMVTEEDLLIRATVGRQFAGGHHLAIFLANAPKGTTEPYACTDDMVNFRYVTGGGGRPGTDIVIPDGLALRVDTGETIVVQSHYINTSAETWTVMDAIDVLKADATTEPVIMDSLILNNGGFSVPAGNTGESLQECTVESEMKLHLATGHMHTLGTVYDLTLTRAETGQTETLFHSSDAAQLKDFIGFSEFDPPMAINPGDTLATRCQWNNSTTHELTFPEEMCAAVMYYSPGQGTLLCVDGRANPAVLDFTPAPTP